MLIRIYKYFPIRYKIIVPPVSIVVLASLVIYFNYLNKPRSDSIESAKSLIIKLGDIISFGLGKSNNHNDVLEVMNWAKKDKELRFIRVIDKNDHLVIDYNPDNLSSLDYEVGGIMEMGKMLFYTTDNIYGEVGGRLTIGYSMERVYTHLSYEQRNALILSVSILLIGVMLSYLFSHRITQRILKLNNATREITQAKKEIDIKKIDLDLDGNDEIGELARDFNSMVKKLNKSQRELNSYSSDLVNKNFKLIQSEDSLKQKNLELAKTNEELDNFVYSISHDIRAPLTSILGIINLMKIDENFSTGQDYTLKIEESVKRLERYTSDVLNFSRNARTIVSPNKIALTLFIKNCYQQLGLRYLESVKCKCMKLIVENNGSEFIYTDRYRLKLILSNIFSNAIKYRDKSKPIGTIKVRTMVTRSTFLISINDNGIGIKQSDSNKIFNMFHRANLISSGSGIGLYIVKEVVKKLNGSVFVDSEVKNWTSFKIELPNMYDEWKINHKDIVLLEKD